MTLVIVSLLFLVALSATPLLVAFRILSASSEETREAMMIGSLLTSISVWILWWGGEWLRLLLMAMGYLPLDLG